MMAALLSSSIAACNGAPTPAISFAITHVAGDNGGTGWDPNEPGLAPSVLGRADWTLLTRIDLAGAHIYAQPLVADGIVVVADEADDVFGYDEATDHLLWEHTLGTPEPMAETRCLATIEGQLGITATPVIDARGGTVYVTYRVWDGASAQSGAWWLTALDIRTGLSRPQWPIPLIGAATNSGAKFNGVDELQRAGLMLIGDTVFAGFGSFCDRLPFRGWIASVRTDNRFVRFYDTEPDAEAGAVWEAGGSLVSDRPGEFLVTTGNGDLPDAGEHASTSAHLGNSLVRFTIACDGLTLTPVDYYAPPDSVAMNAADADFGSAAPVLLPDSLGLPTHPHLVLQAAKDGRVLLLDRDQLGGRSMPGAGDGTGVVASIRLQHHIYARPAVWPGDGGLIYVVTQDGLAVLRFDRTSTPARLTTVAWVGGYAYGTGAALLTSDGTREDSAVVWVEVRGTNQLVAYDARPSRGSLMTLFTAPLQDANRFGTPTAAGGRVYVGTGNGALLVFGSAVTAAATDAPPPAPIPGPACG